MYTKADPAPKNRGMSITGLIKILILFIILSAALQNLSYYILIDGFRSQTSRLRGELSRYLDTEPFSDMMDLLSRMEKNTAAMQKRITWMATLSLSLALAMAVWISRRLLGPLRILIQGLKEISLENQAQLTGISAPHEILEALQTFNSMSEKLCDAAETLEKTAGLRAAGEAAALLAHEIKNPLSAAGMALTALKRRLAGPEQQEMADEIEEALERINHAVTALSDLTRPQKIHPGPLPLAPLLTTTMTLTSRVAAKSETALSLDGLESLPDHEKTEILGARETALRVLVNLVLNAIRATPGGKVQIQLVRQDDRIILDIDDNGPGLPEDFDILNIQPFRSSFENGVGLGLIVVKSGCDAMGWEIQALKSPLDGARFRLGIPAIRGPEDRED